MSVNGALLTKASFLFFTDNVKLIYIYLNFVCNKNWKVAHVSKISEFSRFDKYVIVFVGSDL